MQGSINLVLDFCADRAYPCDAYIPHLKYQGPHISYGATQLSQSECQRVHGCGQSVRHPEQYARSFRTISGPGQQLSRQVSELLADIHSSLRTHTSLLCLQERLLHAKEPCGHRHCARERCSTGTRGGGAGEATEEAFQEDADAGVVVAVMLLC